METAIQFLERMYLPGYMTILSEDYSGDKAWFDFRPVEPQVTILSDRYLTPRGTHICLSQSSYCFFERLMIDRGYFNPGKLHQLGFEGRLKLVEFNQRFRREVKLSDLLQGRLDLTKLRHDKIPILRMDFDLGNRAITGSLTGVIAPHSMPQTNSDILRIDIS